MLIKMFRANSYGHLIKSRLRSWTVFLVAAIAACVAGAFVYGSQPSFHDSVAFAQSIRVASIDSADAGAPLSMPVTIHSAIGSRHFADEGIDAPRECDLQKGISTACVFMD